MKNVNTMEQNLHKKRSKDVKIDLTEKFRPGLGFVEEGKCTTVTRRKTTVTRRTIQ